MLLSVIDLVEYGVITSNQIEFSEHLEQQFQHNWSRYVGQSDVFQPRVGTPFWHLNNEPFWRLVPYEGGDEAIAVYLQGNSYAPGTTRKLISYAEIDQDLFDLLQYESNRATLRTT
jgi:putative restriction endonuclease